MMKVLKESFVNILYPPVCPICGKPAPYENGVRERICQTCMGKISYVDEPRCMKCGKHINDDTQEYCSDCAENIHEFQQAAATFEYAQEITDSIYRFKYKNHREYADTYGFFMSKVIGKNIDNWKVDAIVPVPLHEKKEKSRGYNQAGLIAQKLGDNLGLFVDERFLLRVKETAPMKSLNDRQRAENLEGAFACRRDKTYENVLLVDDIYTTGTTADACARAMKRAGVKKIFFASLCIGDGF